MTQSRARSAGGPELPAFHGRPIDTPPGFRWQPGPSSAAGVGMVVYGREGERFAFPEAGPEMFELTCVNHPEGRWLTKNPDTRHIHFVGWDRIGSFGPGDRHPEFGIRECPCPYSDLRVILPEAGE